MLVSQRRGCRRGGNTHTPRVDLARLGFRLRLLMMRRNPHCRLLLPQELFSTCGTVKSHDLNYDDRHVCSCGLGWGWGGAWASPASTCLVRTTTSTLAPILRLGLVAPEPLPPDLRHLSCGGGASPYMMPAGGDHSSTSCSPMLKSPGSGYPRVNCTPHACMDRTITDRMHACPPRRAPKPQLRFAVAHLQHN